MKKKELKKQLKQVQKIAAELITKKNQKINDLEISLRKEKDKNETLAKWANDLMQVDDVNRIIVDELTEFILKLEKIMNEETDLK